MRVRDWQSRLAACIVERMRAPFEWGVNDCASFAADCVQAVTGVDRMADLRGGYANERQALRLLSIGGGLSAMVTERLGPSIAANLAQPGDVGVTMQGDREALCVCGGSEWHMPAEQGMATLSAGQVLRAWRCEGA